VVNRESFRQVFTLDEFVWLHELAAGLAGRQQLAEAGALLTRIGSAGWTYLNLLRLGDVVISPDTAETRRFRDWLRATDRYWEKVEGPVMGSLGEAELHARRLPSAAARHNVTWAAIHFDRLDFERMDFQVRIRMAHQVTPSTAHLVRIYVYDIECIYGGAIICADPQGKTESYKSIILCSEIAYLKVGASKIRRQSTFVQCLCRVCADLWIFAGSSV